MLDKIPKFGGDNAEVCMRLTKVACGKLMRNKKSHNWGRAAQEASY